ncbi:PD40 domain-containing protein [Emticicia sp. C21]|uniref:Kelch repeat-containing protein n=1 Tax=Emticicia sp. C21 TaxID=2302915 RepID=UPI000E348A2B|nr:PD40 domain-containing protein [Emticicia sp. C21]RFS17266.1 hypothetical protein D0T08_05660 [Emticicia sp. C21]
MKKLKITIFLTLTLGLGIALSKPTPYFGLPAPGNEAQVFAKGIVSADALEHSAPAISKENDVVLWCLLDSPMYILESRKVNGKWTKPARPSFSSENSDDVYPRFSPDGKILYFSSRRPLPDGFPKLEDMWIWKVEKTKDGWGKPVPLDPSVCNGAAYAHSITSSGHLYYSYRKAGAKMLDIMAVSVNTPSEKLVTANLNTENYEDGPLISHKEDFIIFESDRPGSLGGTDLFICFNQNGQWTEAINMGTKINTEAYERFAGLSPDGKYLFWGSSRNADNNIYWIDASVIDELRPGYVSKNIPAKRAHHELVYDEKSNTVMLFGGSSPIDGGKTIPFFNDVWSYNGKAWKKVGNIGDERSGMKMAYNTRQQKIYSFGGFANNNSLADLRVFEKGQWITINELPEMKATEPGFVYDSKRDKFVLFGGMADRDLFNNATYEWDGKTWKKFEGISPQGRSNFAMIYDEKRGKTVLYGGMNDGIWEFDGSSWVNIKPEGENPGERIAAGYCYDSKRGMMIFSGGMSNGKRVNDTWGWDGVKWHKLSTMAPMKRAMGYMVYDKKRDKVVLFGGRISWPIDENDTWEWDGETWKKVL